MLPWIRDWWQDLCDKCRGARRVLSLAHYAIGPVKHLV
jgi:hypothetical protein